MRMFLSKLKIRALNYGWNDVLEIPINVNRNNVRYMNLIERYGEITMDDVIAHAEQYVGTETRTAQNSVMMANCLLTTLTKVAYNQVTAYGGEYSTDDGEPVGAMLLKVILKQCHIDTRATSRYLRLKLKELDKYMEEIKFDIVKFNLHVKELTHALTARGERSTDLISNLFEAYKVVPDDDFKAFIQRKEDEYDEGDDIDSNRLMNLASVKYSVLKQRGTWNAPDPRDAKIVALQSQLATIKKQVNSQSNKKNKSNDNNNRRNNKESTPASRREEWMTKAPKNDEPKFKVVNNLKYHWCPTHKAWTRHKPEDCKGIKYRMSQSESQQAKANAQNERKQRLQLDQAMNAAQQQQESEDEE